MSCPDLGQNSALQSGHGKEQIGVVLAIHGDKSALPLDGCHRSGQTIFDVPKHSPSQIDVMFHESHSGISWPALFVVVTHNVFIVGIGMLGQVPLDEITGLLGTEAEEHVDLVDVTRVKPDGMRDFSVNILK